MGKRFVLNEDEKRKIQELYSIDEEKKDSKKFCHGGNVRELSEISGDDEVEDYIDGVTLRKKGVNSLVDKIELLKTLRLHPKIDDGGEHLCYCIMNDLKSFKPYNYYDEVRQECLRAMDKIIELYKEHEHGEELMKDLQKVYDNHHISPRAKEFIKHGINIVKGV